MTQITKKYLFFLEKYPLRTAMVSTGFLSFCGDVLAQQAVEKRGWKHHQKIRSLKLTAMGVFFIAPTLRTWYNILDKLVKGSAGMMAGKKMLIDQLAFAPVFIANFFVISDLLDGKSQIDIKENLGNNYFSTVKVNWCIWPAVQLVNFYFVPLHHRVLVVNTVALFWNTYLSFAVNKGASKQIS